LIEIRKGMSESGYLSLTRDLTMAGFLKPVFFIEGPMERQEF
jgi:hypothetical protein